MQLIDLFFTIIILPVLPLFKYLLILFFRTLPNDN